MSAIDDLTELQQAIFNYMWTQSNDFKTLCVGGFHHDEYAKDKEEQYPNTQYFFVSFIYDRDSCSKYAEAIIQFRFVHNDKDVTKINKLIAEFDSRFSDCEDSLVLPNFKIHDVRSINVRPPRKTVANRFEASRDYKMIINRK